ncbi:MAG: hypothetical protein JWM57_1100 [Phycisphaerales bacterium]|nr:hypothetical protein [Phycisphaerales bacterium]
MVSMASLKLRLFCWTIAVACAAMAVVALAFGLLWPLDQSGNEGPNPAESQVKNASLASSALTMAQFEPLIARLRAAPLLPQATTPSTETVAVVTAGSSQTSVQQQVDIQLLGTVVEAGNSYAIFETSVGVEVKKAGEIIGTSRIEHIDDGVAVLTRDGQTVTLRVPPPAGG